MEEIEAWDQKT